MQELQEISRRQTPTNLLEATFNRIHNISSSGNKERDFSNSFYIYIVTSREHIGFSTTHCKSKFCIILMSSQNLQEAKFNVNIKKERSIISTGHTKDKG
jgi:hypothetical protein